VRLALSLRTKFLLIVVLAAVAPLGLLGLWLTQSAARSGETLLRQRLGDGLARTMEMLGPEWIRLRSALLTLAEDSSVQEMLGRSVASSSDRPSAGIIALLRPIGSEATRITIQDGSGTIRWRLGEPPAAEGTFVVPLPIYRRFSGQRLGTLVAEVRLVSLLGGAVVPGTAGAVVGFFDRSSGAPLGPTPFDPMLLTRERFVWGGDEWLALRQTLDEPPLDLVAAAPLSPFTEPFEQAARRGGFVLLGVALLCLLLAVSLSRRVTRSLARLVSAAEAVTRGDLDRRVEEPSSDEVGRLAGAFNSMTASLRRSMEELTQRESLAAVGRFAAALAHEIRNPLTAIRLDLQRVEQTLEPESPAKTLQGRALDEVDRLDRAVSGALGVARIGRIERRPMELRPVLEAALASARPEVVERGGVIEPLPTNLPSIELRGDPGALQQVFLNLLLNAAQAIDQGGHIAMTIEPAGEAVGVTVRDDGRGIPPEQLERVFEPFYSTKPAGTGLGLLIARQIVMAHGGVLDLESVPGVGTAAMVRLPLLGAVDTMV
jgi:two-component system nitrogen regulation sensor histidine kinase NtrY